MWAWEGLVCFLVGKALHPTCPARGVATTCNPDHGCFELVGAPAQLHLTDEETEAQTGAWTCSNSAEPVGLGAGAQGDANSPTPGSGSPAGRLLWQNHLGKTTPDIYVTAPAEAGADVRRGEDPKASPRIRALLFTYSVNSSHQWEPRSHCGGRM